MDLKGKIWIPGSGGMLGKAFKKELYTSDVICTDRKSIDISDTYSVLEFVKEKDIKTIINCTGFTNVDNAEMNKGEAWKANVDGAMNIALASRMFGCFSIHFSTDYVFYGSEGTYNEYNICTPANYYGLTKHHGEQRFLSFASSGFIIRTSWLFSEHGNNFVKTMLKLFKSKEEVRVVNDQFGCPTYAPYLAKTCLELYKHDFDNVDIWHITNSGVTTWYDFAVDIYNTAKEAGLIKRDVNIIPISTDELVPKRMAYRPKSSVLETKKVESILRRSSKPWKQSLADCIGKIIELE